MKLKYNVLLRASTIEIMELEHFTSDYDDAVSVQIDFRDKEVELFDTDGHLVAHRKFEEIFTVK